MRDKRPVDELSVEELERILAIRKREERQNKLQRMQRAGRIVEPLANAPVASSAPIAAPAHPPTTAAPAPAPAAPPVPMIRDMSPRFEDESDFASAPAQQRHFWRSFMNQSLLLIEVAAVAGLIFLGYQMFLSISNLQRETASAVALADEQRRATMPTLAPTPQIRLSEIVLPGGHVFTASGEVQFNFAEIPETLRGLVETEILRPVISRPQPTRETALELNIPKLNIETTIVQGTDWEALKLGIGQFTNGVNPNDAEGNLVLSAHNDIYGEYFRYLDQLEPGDEFYVRTETQIHTYRVTESQIVEPNEVWVMQPRGGAVATLISCYPYQVNDKRYIVFAERVA